MFSVEMSRRFDAVQGLPSTVRGTDGRVPVVRCAVTMRLGFAFGDDRLDRDQRFLGAETADQLLDEYADRLEAQTWTEIFDATPTFEYVTRWLFEQIEPKLPELTHVTLHNDTLDVTTTYTAA
ncbi:hypothetical protein [Nocardia stercoris]|uniref:6-carboxy-5,6,7,8-tetrahydropterin synthase n=1 Tax=Nocardia stercoris TaxID=2483361 RepID=A0A3M2LAB3_9NOCA|nr:hypothetical protein [Nocardia stercoris]RMI33966.1 hypothetical protein EBN03_05755 [Nocardia stercoris]